MRLPPGPHAAAVPQTSWCAVGVDAVTSHWGLFSGGLVGGPAVPTFGSCNL